MIEEIIKERGKKSYKELADKYGCTVPQLRYKLKKHGIPPMQVGPPRINFEDQKVNVGGFVKRKHHNKVQRMIDELIKPYR